VQGDVVRDPAPQLAVQGEVEGRDDPDAVLGSGTAEKRDVQGNSLLRGEE
jgi:hypothetical protein